MTGRSSSAVGTTHDASKVTPCIVISLLAAKPPSPEVVHDKAPVPPGRVFLYDHIDPSWPRMFRIASCCQLPASRPAPGLHPRKGGRQIEKTHNTEGLGSENISMFFSNSIANRKGFLPRPAPFRGWTQGAGREAGSAQGDAARNISANAPYLSTNQIGAQAEGAFSWHTLIGPLTLITYETEASGGLSFESSRVVPTAEENRPVNVALPVCIYLGLPA